VFHINEFTMTTTTTTTGCRTKKTTQKPQKHQKHQKHQKPLNGANELKKAIQEYTATMNEMKARFETDLEAPLAKIDPPQICRPLHDFHARQCGVTHYDFILNRRQSDELTATETHLTDTLTALEKLRKMLVTNKQQRKTAHKHNRRVAISIQASFQSTELEPVIVVSDTLMDGFLTINQMDANAKQYHRTIARNILDEANRLLTQLRCRFIVAYQVALDDTVGKIIQHAEKCRGFIESTLRLALIEFCASYWFHAQKDAMDQTEYFVTATECQNPAKGGYGDIQIQIHTIQEQTLVASFHVDDAFSTQIITEEAVQAFEWEQQSLWFDKQAAARERHAKYEQEQAKFYADLAMGATAEAEVEVEAETSDVCASSSAAWMEMDEFDDCDSDYDSDYDFTEM